MIIHFINALTSPIFIIFQLFPTAPPSNNQQLIVVSIEVEVEVERVLIASIFGHAYFYSGQNIVQDELKRPGETNNGRNDPHSSEAYEKKT